MTTTDLHRLPRLAEPRLVIHITSHLAPGERARLARAVRAYRDNDQDWWEAVPLPRDRYRYRLWDKREPDSLFDEDETPREGVHAMARRLMVWAGRTFDYEIERD